MEALQSVLATVLKSAGKFCVAAAEYFRVLLKIVADTFALKTDDYFIPVALVAVFIYLGMSLKKNKGEAIKQA